MNDDYNLQRFLDAQREVYEAVCAELAAGNKRSHWMWFIFPQLQGLGHSRTAQFYGISGRQEAQAYLQHPVLGSRLRHCTQLLLGVEGRSIDAIVGYPDNLKFRSSLTLFAQVTPDNQIFTDALNRFYDGHLDPLTLERL